MAAVKPEAIERINALQDKDRKIVVNAWLTPAGKDLIDLIIEMYGDPKIHSSQLKTFVELGEFQVVQILRRKLKEENVNV